MTEKILQRHVLKFLKTLNNTYFFKAMAGSIGGIPDIICCINGNFIALELKQDGKKPTPLQDINLLKIRNALGLAFVVNPSNFENVKIYLREISEGKSV